MLLRSIYKTTNNVIIRPNIQHLQKCNKSTLQTILSDQLQEMRDAGTYKVERVITSPQSSMISVQNMDNDVINFCANNYLGLSNDPELVEAAKATLDSHGFGLSSVRFICGTQDIHKELEEKISKFHGMEDTILYPSCFDANAGLFEGILTDEDAVISDELNHASIIDGIRLCKAQRHRYKHMNMESLEEELIKAKDARVRLIVTDGAFSMDGDIAPLAEIDTLAKKYDARVFIDECHATGFLGATGRGTDEHFDVKVDIINSTLGKALGGGTGGYTSGPKEVIDTLRQKGRPYLFSNTLAPAVVGASLKVFDKLMTSSDLVEKIRFNTHRFRDRMTEAGFTINGARDHPICPVMLGDARLASEMADAMLTHNVFVIGFSYPVVPKGKARIRCQVSAAHTTEQIDHSVDAFIKVGKQFGVI
uniref:2-amino-3-ketobutyrate coenzyme A ligase n=1 Tax=uncultured gamma proteobacterium HF0010_26J14 TaxID=723564 RepID=E7C1V4_9GAMM|nr:7-keto-8-aminopelargonate synthetase and related enzymes [uncultured gamma proteobacterium HF0010_26J14]